MATYDTHEIPRAILAAIFLTGLALVWWLQVMR